MSKPAKVLLFYYIFLGASSLFLSLMGIKSYYYLYAGQQMEFNPMIIPTIIGGIVSLWLTIRMRSLKIFLLIYFGLWALRFTLLYFANKVGETQIMGRTLRVDLIVANYYKTVSRLDTHLPFVLYWFIDYFFKGPPEKQKEAQEQASDKVISDKQA